MFSLEVVNEFVEFKRSPRKRRIFHLRVSMGERWGGLVGCVGGPQFYGGTGGGASLSFLIVMEGYHRNSSAPCEERKEKSPSGGTR